MLQHTFRLSNEFPHFPHCGVKLRICTVYIVFKVVEYSAKVAVSTCPMKCQRNEFRMSTVHSLIVLTDLLTHEPSLPYKGGQSP
jgi:hypothetical protein